MTAGSRRGMRQEMVADDAVRLRVSALVDDEFDEETVDRTIDALIASDELARFWADAHRAGDWMRSDEVVGVGDTEKFLQRFAVALASEPSIVAPAALKNVRARRFWIRTGLPGVSVAAALVVVAWVAIPFGAGKQDAREVATVVVTKQQPLAAAAPAQVSAKPMDTARLNDYFAVHREVSPFAYRGSSREAGSVAVSLTDSSGSVASQSSP